MLQNTSFRIIIILFIVIANISCDQVSKKIARESIQPGDKIEVLNDNLFLMNVENRGAFLSAGANLPKFIKDILLLVLPLIMLIGALIYLSLIHI